MNPTHPRQPTPTPPHATDGVRRDGLSEADVNLLTGTALLAELDGARVLPAIARDLGVRIRRHLAGEAPAFTLDDSLFCLDQAVQQLGRGEVRDHGRYSRLAQAIADLVARAVGRALTAGPAVWQ
jgi:hypothetical protein